MATDSAFDCLEANKKVVRTFYKHLDAGQIDEAFSLLAPELRMQLIVPPPLGDKIFNKAELLTFFREAFAPVMASPFRVSVLELTAEGNRVAIEATSTAQNKKGMTLKQRYHTLMVVEDGLITEFREYLDSAHFLEFMQIDSK